MPLARMGLPVLALALRRRFHDPPHLGSVWIATQSPTRSATSMRNSQEYGDLQPHGEPVFTSATKSGALWDTWDITPSSLADAFVSTPLSVTFDDLAPLRCHKLPDILTAPAVGKPGLPELLQAPPDPAVVFHPNVIETTGMDT